jgi:uncharacterized protein
MEELARGLLRMCQTWAVVGCSPDPTRDSHRVARTLQRHGYDVIPVHPAGGDLLGARCYPSLLDVPPSIPIEVVDIFRRSEHAGRHVDEAIAVGARAVWFQLGVRDELAARRARRAGLMVVEQRCPATELSRMHALAR